MTAAALMLWWGMGQRLPWWIWVAVVVEVVFIDLPRALGAVA